MSEYSNAGTVIATGDVRKVGCDFSSTSVVLDEICNYDFKHGMNAGNISCDYVYAYLYQTISAVSERVGGVIYENILNYLDNISNIDLCKVKSLQSIVSMFGTNYSLFNQLNDIPLDLQNLIDVFSIKREYLLNSGKVNRVLADKLSACAVVSSAAPSAVGYMDDAKFTAVLSSVYYSAIVDSLVSTYYDDLTRESIVFNPVNYERYLQNEHKIYVRPDTVEDTIRSLKVKYSIDKYFNEVQIVDAIEAGQDSLDGYSEHEQEILLCEIENRKQAYNSLHPATKYYYYRVRRVQEYIDFVESRFCDKTDVYRNVAVYSPDPDYFEIALSGQRQLLNRVGDAVTLDYDMIRSVTELLTSLTLKISELRSSLKSYAQRINMRGTYQLIRYIIYDYLRENIVPVINLSSVAPVALDQDTTTLDIIRYNDPTDYFNVSTEYDLSNGLSGTNYPYWMEQSSLSGVLPKDNTNIFAAPNADGVMNFAFSDSQIQQFYISSLQMNFRVPPPADSDQDVTSARVSCLNQFLSSTFYSAADATFMDLSGNLCCYSDDVDYKRRHFRAYSGVSAAAMPYLNYKNSVHPSYQVHPFLRNFIESVAYQYPIENLQTLASDTMFEMMRNSIDSYIDDDGYVIDVWNNPLNRNSDYLTRYERATHRDSLNRENRVFSYDGFCYWPALSEFINGGGDFTNGIVDNTNDYYNGLNLSIYERRRIVQQLYKFRNALVEISRTPGYDIYRYGLDIYGNSYILVKKYDVSGIAGVKDVPLAVRETTPGQLWIRLKNHPIAFPAYCYSGNDNNNDVSQIYVESDKSVNEFRHAVFFAEKAFAGFPQILDFSISEARTQIQFLFDHRRSDGGVERLVLPGNILKEYNKGYSIRRNQLKVRSLGADTTYPGHVIQSGEFKQFMTLGKRFGFIYADVSPARDSDSPVLGLSCCTFLPKAQSNDQFEELTSLVRMDGFRLGVGVVADSRSLKLDYCNNVVTVCYLSCAYDPAQFRVTDFLDADVRYGELTKYGIATFDRAVLTRQFTVTTKNIYEKLNTGLRAYSPYTDIGFYPAVGASVKSLRKSDWLVDVSDTTINDRFDLTQVAKFQLIGDSALSGIDFKQYLPIRMYEKYMFSAVDLHNGCSAIGYDKAHFFEETTPRDLGPGNRIIYKPYELYKALRDNNLDSNLNLVLKIDETYRNFFMDIPPDNIFLKYDREAINPWLLAASSEQGFPRHYETPGWYDKDDAQVNHVSADLSNMIKIKLEDDEEEPALSANWFTVRDEDGSSRIKIDINPQYFNRQKYDGYTNRYNYQHTFASLDFPGSAAYVKVYNSSFRPDPDQAVIAGTGRLNIEPFYDAQHVNEVLYVKNVSDTKPKLLIVRDYPWTNQARRYRASVLALEEAWDGVYICDESTQLPPNNVAIEI